MRRFLSATLSVALAASLSLVTASKAEALAIEGCKGKYKLMAQPWILDTYMQVPNKHLIDLRDIQVSATTAYYYCPNRRKDDKVKPLWVSYCYSHLSKRHWLFDGVKFDSRWADYNTDIDTGEIVVPNNNGQQNCVTLDIPHDSERWLILRDAAGWLTKATIVRKAAFPDHVRWFEDENGQKFRRFTPAVDTSLSDWMT